MFRTLQRWAASRRFSSFVIVAVLLGGVFFLYFWRLGTLTPGLSPEEVAARESSSSLQAIKENPLNAPQRLLQLTFSEAGQNGAFWLRLSSVILALFFIYLFYVLLRQWFGRFVGSLAVLTFASTPLVILLARSAAPDILLISPIAILAGYVWLETKERHRDLAWVALVFFIGLSLYTPGVIWLVLVGLIFSGKYLNKLPSVVSPVVLTLSFFLLLLMLAPLGLAIFEQPQLAKSLLLIPDPWTGLTDSLKSLARAAWALVWQAPYHVPLIIGRLPLLNLMQVVLVVFGVYVMWTRARKEMLLLASVILISITLAGFNKNLVLLALGLPALAVFVAAGLRYLYGEWRQVFPRNPLPRALAITLMVSLVLVNLLIGIRYALIAWPHTADTKNTHVLQ